MTPGRRAAVLGSPIGHSLSPVLHRAAYDALGLAGWTYDAYDVDAAGLPGFLAGLDDSWAGLSLTMPLKAAVLPLLDNVTPTVEAVGGANTVLLENGRRTGDNTDVPGILDALNGTGLTSVSWAAVLGGGATARAAVHALGALTDRVTVHLRDPQRDPGRRAGLHRAAEPAGTALALQPWTAAPEALRAPLVVATTVAGATDDLADHVPDRPGLLFDVLYDPWPTALAAAWTARGGRVVDGLDLLVHQAARQVVLMTGTPVGPGELVPVLRAAGEAALRARPKG